MKKIYFLFTLAVMIFITSCSDDVSVATNPVSAKSPEGLEYVFANKPVNRIQTRASSLRGKTWKNGETIRIKFVQDPADSQNYSLAQNKFKELSMQWLMYTNLKFEFVPESENADVKIAFNWNKGRIVWSEIGTDSRLVPQNEPSTNFILHQNNSTEVNGKSFRIAVLRMVGHILGLVNEHQSAKSTIKLKEQETIWYLVQSGWTEEQARSIINKYYTESETNSAEFDEKSIMLWYFPSYLLEEGKGAIYNTELSEKDKQTVQALYPGDGGHIVVPDRISLIYKQTSDANSYPYTGVRIGEYYWVNENFYHRVPRGYGTIGWENDYPMTQAILDKYMPCIEINKDKFQVNIDDFNRYYGLHYTRESINYMNRYGKMYEENNSFASGWELPSYVDYRQLFAMCPFWSGKTNGTNLDHLDINFALCAKEGDNPMAFNIPADPERPGRHTYYYRNGEGVNIYDFNLMAGGARLNGPGGWSNGILHWENGAKEHPGTFGDIYHLFYTAGLYTKESHVYVWDYLDTHYAYSAHWFNARWCRKLSDIELGYRLYINQEQTDIKKLPLTENAPDGYNELPKGYLRGFYVQYILDNPNPKYTITDIIEFSKNVEDRTM